MNIKTAGGITCYILPENARCSFCGKSPENMDECPIKNFDDFGDVCVPELCDYYKEEDDDLTGDY